MPASKQNEHLSLLVHELSKKNPNSDLIKTKTHILGIPYSPDLIILMSEVLVFLSKSPKKKQIPKEKTL